MKKTQLELKLSCGNESDPDLDLWPAAYRVGNTDSVSEKSASRGIEDKTASVVLIIS